MTRLSGHLRLYGTDVHVPSCSICYISPWDVRELRREAMLIVSGKIYVRPGARQAFLMASLVAVAQAREARGCRDFVVAADPLEPDRVNVYEEWDSEETLMIFRGDGPAQDVSSSIVRADVSRHVVASSGPA
jgi:quinol monooxygenase YgiN